MKRQERYPSLIGLRFSRLIVKSYSGLDRFNNKMWICVCDCGNSTITSSHKLMCNNTKSCGCIQKEWASKIGRKNLTTHGLSSDADGKIKRLYQVWENMKSRCYNNNSPDYKNYGGRGILICDEWLNYKSFHNWSINNGYKDDLTIERVNNNLGYDPDNCVWILKKHQSLNKRNSRIIKYNGVTKIMEFMAKDYNISSSTLHYRLKKGWSIEKSLTTPVRSRDKVLTVKYN